MRDYQPHKNNPYYLPKTLYNRVLAVIRDYDRRREEYNEMLHSSPSPSDGMPRGGTTSDSVADKAIRMEAAWTELHAVEQALMRIPEEYRAGVFDNVRYRCQFPANTPAHYKTWLYWRRRFVYWVANNLKLP